LGRCLWSYIMILRCSTTDMTLLSEISKPTNISDYRWNISRTNKFIWIHKKCKKRRRNEIVKVRREERDAWDKCHAVWKFFYEDSLRRYHVLFEWLTEEPFSGSGVFVELSLVVCWQLTLFWFNCDEDEIAWIFRKWWWNENRENCEKSLTAFFRDKFKQTWDKKKTRSFSFFRSNLSKSSVTKVIKIFQS
jgi:hypothetical protein